MKKKVLVALATLAMAALALPASPASAKPAQAEKVNPAQYCRSVYQPFTSPATGIRINTYVVPVEFSFGGMTSVEDFSLSSFAACVSTVASGMRADGIVPASAISKPAYLAQCDFLEQVGAISYPYSFYGMYPAKNRADCARILQGVHSGRLPLPGPAPVG